VMATKMPDTREDARRASRAHQALRGRRSAALKRSLGALRRQPGHSTAAATGLFLTGGADRGFDTAGHVGGLACLSNLARPTMSNVTVPPGFPSLAFYFSTPASIGLRTRTPVRAFIPRKEERAMDRDTKHEIVVLSLSTLAAIPVVTGIGLAIVTGVLAW
jgi:hypothetical protein